MYLLFLFLTLLVQEMLVRVLLFRNTAKNINLSLCSMVYVNFDFQTDNMTRKKSQELKKLDHFSETTGELLSKEIQ